MKQTLKNEILISEVEIIDFQKNHSEAFKQLNLDWINCYFEVEAKDLEVLEKPEENILQKGGFIKMAVLNGEIVGTCALLKTSEKIYELAKMAVSEKLRGKKIGYLLGKAIMEKAVEIGAEKIFLLSNRKLIPALHLYQKLGFVEVAMAENEYKRADIQMEMDL